MNLKKKKKKTLSKEIENNDVSANEENGEKQVCMVM